MEMRFIIDDLGQLARGPVQIVQDETGATLGFLHPIALDTVRWYAPTEFGAVEVPPGYGFSYPSVPGVTIAIRPENAYKVLADITPVSSDPIDPGWKQTFLLHDFTLFVEENKRGTVSFKLVDKEAKKSHEFSATLQEIDRAGRPDLHTDEAAFVLFVRSLEPQTATKLVKSLVEAFATLWSPVNLDLRVLQGAAELIVRPDRGHASIVIGYENAGTTTLIRIHERTQFKIYPGYRVEVQAHHGRCDLRTIAEGENILSLNGRTVTVEGQDFVAL